MIRGKPPLARSLGFRLAFLLALALLPLGVLSAIQGQSLLRETRARVEAAVLGRTRAAASGEQRAIEQAMGAARVLAALAGPVLRLPPGPERDRARQTCDRVARETVARSDLFSFVGAYDLQGQMRCAAREPPPGWRFPDEMRPVLNADAPRVGMLEEATFTGRPVLFAQVPVLGPSGEVIGQASVSVPHDLAMHPAPPVRGSAEGEAKVDLVTFTAEGRVLTGPADRARTEALLPAHAALAALAGETALAFTADAADGTRRVYAVVPLVAGQVYALGSWPADAATGRDFAARLPPAVLPLLMWLVSLGVALLAAERLVTRHVRRLTRALARFARGEREAPVADLAPGLEDAPWELAALSDTFGKMAAAIIREEAERDETIRQKEMLLREVHHRVKNNLQLIASIMNLQIRRARSAEARTLLRRLQERVMSLATVHRGLYQAASLASLEAGQLLDDILRQVLNMGADHDRRFRLHKDIDRVVLTPDQAVPLALWFTEALTNAMKYAHRSAPGEAARLVVALKAEEGGQVTLAVANSVAEGGAAGSDSETEHSGGLGSQLLEAFAEQLGGSFVTEEGAGWHRATLRFELSARADAPPETAPAESTSPAESTAPAESDADGLGALGPRPGSA